MVDVAGFAAAKITCHRVIQVAVRAAGKDTDVADRDTLRKQVEGQRADVVAWFRSGPGGVMAAIFVVALVGMLILAAVGLLWGA